MRGWGQHWNYFSLIYKEELKKNKKLEIAEKLLQTSYFLLQIFGSGENFLGQPGSSWFNQEVPG